MHRQRDQQFGLQQSGRDPTDAPPQPPPPPKQQANFALSGKLLEDTNKLHGSVLQYAEPKDAKKPKVRWRLYPFKGDAALPVYHVHRQSGYLFGRDRKLADIPTDHPSCSKQQAVLQFRQVSATRADGTEVRRVRPYIIDLNSSNGTTVNGERIDAQRYVELFEKDVVKFGYSSREYVLLHEGSSAAAADEDDAVVSDEESARQALKVAMESADVAGDTASASTSLVIDTSNDKASSSSNKRVASDRHSPKTARRNDDSDERRESREKRRHEKRRRDSSSSSSDGERRSPSGDSRRRQDRRNRSNSPKYGR